MKTTCTLAVLLFGVLFCSQTVAQLEAPERFQWESLPDLPQALSGHFFGASNGALIAAGGSYWTAPPSEGGTRAWLETAYVLEPGGAAWRAAGRRSRPVRDGGCASYGSELLCVGGSDGTRHYAEVFALAWEEGQVTHRTLPPMPSPGAMMGAAVLGDTLYVAGGAASPDSSEALHVFHSLDLSKPESNWQELDPWPGPARINPVMAAQDGAVYLFSGVELHKDLDGPVRRRYLADAYKYDPEKGWATVTAPPKPVAAAPSLALGPAHILVFGGDDGAPKDGHPGFSHDVLAYHTITDTWAPMGTAPEGYVHSPAVLLDKRIVLAGGEERPGRPGASVFAGEVLPVGGRLGWPDHAMMFLYFAVLVLMGIFFSKREKSTDDYFLGGKRVPWWAAGISIYGTLLSAITFLSVPATAFSTNWVFFVGNLLFIPMAPIIIYVYMPFFCRLNLTTAYEYLEKRFHVGVRLFGSAAFILFQLGRVGIVMLLPALALSAATGIDIYIAILAMGVLCTAYTYLGGIEAVIWSDVLQVGVLLGGAVLCFGLILNGLDGGMGTVISMGAAEDKFRLANWGWDMTSQVLWVVVLGRALELLVPYTTDQTVVQRYLTTANERESGRAVWLAAMFSIPSGALFFSLGSALYVYYKIHPDMLDPTLQNDAILPLFIVQQVPTGLAGLVIAAVFAAAMSSLDSSLNSVSAVLVTDYRRLRAGMTEEQGVRLAKGLTLLIGVAGTVSALFLAGAEVKSLWQHYMKIIGLFGGAMAGLFALGIFTRRATGAGAAVGAVFSAVFLFWVQRYTPISFLLYSTVGIVSCVVVGYTASLFLGKPPADLAGLTWSTRTSRPSG